MTDTPKAGGGAEREEERRQQQERKTRRMLERAREAIAADRLVLSTNKDWTYE